MSLLDTLCVGCAGFAEVRKLGVVVGAVCGTEGILISNIGGGRVRKIVIEHFNQLVLQEHLHIRPLLELGHEDHRVFKLNTKVNTLSRTLDKPGKTHEELSVIHGFHVSQQVNERRLGTS